MRSALLRGLMQDAPRKERLAVLAPCFAFAFMLYLSPLGVITVIGDIFQQDGIQIWLTLIPLIICIMLLGLGDGLIAASGLALSILIRSWIVSAYYYDDYFRSPIVSVIPLLIATVLAALLFALLRQRLSSRRRATQARGIIVACLVFALVVMLGQYYGVFVAYPELGEDYTVGEILLSGFLPFSLLQLALITAILSTVSMFALNARQLKEENRWDRGLRAIFRRWLFLLVGLAFVLALDITFCYETAVSVQSALANFKNEVNYIETQIDSYETKTAQLKSLETNNVLGKANAASALIASDTSALSDTARLRALADLLELNSLTVVDGSGTVVADADGVGIGTYNFSSTEQTAKYLALLDGTQTSVTEEPRESIDADGKGSGEYALFAGVPRTDAPGFIQVSIPASEYQDALSAASIASLGDDYIIGTNGNMYVGKDNVILTSNDKQAIGKDFNAETDLWDTDYGPDTMIPMVDNSHVYSYAHGERYGDYLISLSLPYSEVYANRNMIMIWSALLYLLLFAIVFVMGSKLLSSVVISGIDKTNRVLGKITEGDLDQKIDVYENLEFGQLSNGINTTVDALKDSIAEAHERIARELATAHAIQSSALPSTFPPFPEIDAFDIFASMNAAKEVGGDFYDFFLIDEDRLGFLIADVSGKGIPAALFMMTAKTEIQNYMMNTAPGDDIGEAIATVNHHLCIGNEAEMFVTAFIAVLDFRDGEMTYVNAGHNPPLLRHGGTWEWLRDKSGLFLGAMDGLPYRAFSRTLSKDDQLLLYTDGVTEAWSADGQIYGEQRLLDLVQAHAGLPPTALVYKVENELADFAEGRDQADDITMLSLEFGEAPDVSNSARIPASVDQLETVLGFVHAELARRLCPLKVQKQLDIAIEEMFVNVARYAYPDAEEGHPGQVKVTYTYSATPPAITVELDDTGVPYDPLKHEDPARPASADEAEIGGLGIMMTKRLVDDIGYRYEHGHNILTFSKSW